jgi:trimeric autotransporter adhesin
VHRRMVSRWLCVCVSALLLVSLAGAQDIINTVAGGGSNGLPATASAIGNPWSVVQVGTISPITYIGDQFSNRVFKVSGGTLTVVAGNIVGTFGGRTADSFLATQATLNGPEQIAVDGNGNLYIADTKNQAIRFVNLGSTTVNFYNGTADAISVDAGAIQTIVGVDGVTCPASPCGDGGLAPQANLNSPGGVWLDSSGNIYIADTGDNVIRVVNVQATAITPVAGGPTIQPGYIATILGNYQACATSPCGDGGIGTPQVNLPSSVWLDANNDIYVADTNDQVVRLLTTGGTLSRIAGNYSVTCDGNPLDCGDGSVANGSNVFLNNPIGVAADSTGNIYIADTGDQVVREVTASNGHIIAFAGNYTQCSQSCGDGGPATSANLSNPTGVFVDGSGDLFIADEGDNAIREVMASNGDIQTVYGTLLDPEYSGDANPPTVAGHPLDASLYAPTGVVEDNAGNIYVADQQNNRIRKITASTGNISTFAGTGALCLGASQCGEGNPATSAQLNVPSDVAVDGSGNVYIADTENSLIRVVNTQAANLNFYGGSPNGVTIDPGDIHAVVSNVNLARGFNGDGLTAIGSKINFPQGVTLDASGNIYFADTANDLVRVANTQTQAIKVAGVTIQASHVNVIAGTPPVQPNYNPVPCSNPTATCGDGGPATEAMLNTPTGVAIDRSGNIYIADNADNRIRVVNSQGVISTVAGNGNTCTSSCGDNGPATQATLSNPDRVYADYSGTIYIADTNDYVVRVVNPGSSSITVNGIVIGPGEINTVAGIGSHGFSGDGGAATSAQLAAPSGLAADSVGDLLITDSTAWRVRSVGHLVVTAPTASISPNPLTFPATIVSQDTSKATITITNNGNGANLSVSSVAISGANAADFKQTNNCTAVTADGGTCSISVSFTPSAAGTRSATLSISDNAAGSPQAVALSGTGVVGLGISPTSQSVSAGSSATYTITVPAQGFSGSVTLSCTQGLPSGAACSFSSNPVAPGKSSTLTISTAAASAALIAPATKRSPTPFYAIWLLLPAMLLSTAGFTAPKRKKLISYFLLTLAVAGVLFLVACGGSGGGSSGTTGGTPAGTYNITVQGKAGSTTATQQITLTVQ